MKVHFRELWASGPNRAVVVVTALCVPLALRTGGELWVVVLAGLVVIEHQVRDLRGIRRMEQNR